MRRRMAEVRAWKNQASDGDGDVRWRCAMAMCDGDGDGDVDGFAEGG
jgi:hypothetical protein